MQVDYEKLIIRISRVNWGEGKLDKLIADASKVKKPTVRIHIKGQEKPRDYDDFKEVDLPVEERNAVTRVEVLLNAPLGAMGRTDWNDNADKNTLQWGGTRGSSCIPKKMPMRGTPMFFRHDGTPVDMLGLYNNATCFLVFNGPSVATLDTFKLKNPGIVSFGVNNGGHELRPNFWTCVDDPKRFMPSIWQDPKITKFVPMAHFVKPTWDPTNGVEGPLVQDHPNVIGYRRNEHFVASRFLTEQTINWGNHADLGGCRSCMLAAIRIVHLLGFKRVFLVGADFHMAPDQKYFFAEGRTPGAINSNNSSYKLLTERFEALVPYFAAEDFQVFNCNPNSALKVFPIVEFEEAINMSTINTDVSTEGMYVEKGRPRRNDRGIAPPINATEE